MKKGNIDMESLNCLITRNVNTHHYQGKSIHFIELKHSHFHQQEPIKDIKLCFFWLRCSANFLILYFKNI